MLRKMSLEDAIKLIPENARIFVHGGAATPNALLSELLNQSDRLKQATIIHLHTEGEAKYADSGHQFRVINLFVGTNLRQKIDYDRIDYLPAFLSEIPDLFLSKQIPLDVALLHVSPPDRFGYCSLGVSVDVAKAASESARILIAQVNPNMPRVHGDGILPIKAFSAIVDVDESLPEIFHAPASKDEEAIARNVASLVEDGSTLQIGIGSIPNGVVKLLHDRKNLGLHTEMWSDGALDLIHSGAVTNSNKNVHRGKSVSGFLMGTRRLYDFVNDNPSVVQFGADYVNNPVTIARNPKVVAINSAVEIDLTGQVCADSVGHRIISGVGGQMDFMRGAALSKGGKPIIALTSRTRKSCPKIVSALQQGAGVVMTRAHAHYVVTEYGIAQLYGKTLRERARNLIHIAHPEDRELLERKFFESHASY